MAIIAKLSQPVPKPHCSLLLKNARLPIKVLLAPCMMLLLPFGQLISKESSFFLAASLAKVENDFKVNKKASIALNNKTNPNMQLVNSCHPCAIEADIDVKKFIAISTF
jgi:hypothetical protein